MLASSRPPRGAGWPSRARSLSGYPADSREPVLREQAAEGHEEVVAIGAEDLLRLRERLVARLRVVVELLDRREERVELLVREPQPRLTEEVLAVGQLARRLPRRVDTFDSAMGFVETLL